ncbi:hypothetical protein FS837_010374 [Tulasnella sp. UAMH 9824]|nr:hypothetical protein FS837_010374 [Tulasnella sp. UAMH 9824]
MPENVAQAHHALIGGDACRFLGSILTNTQLSEWTWRDRAGWRAKGEAMTCLGNIIERMNETELREHVPKAVIEAAVAMKESEEAPLTQRGQAIFMLQRYTAAADRCGVEPYHREEAPTLENEQEGAEVQVGSAQEETANISCGSFKLVSSAPRIRSTTLRFCVDGCGDGELHLGYSGAPNTQYLASASYKCFGAFSGYKENKGDLASVRYPSLRITLTETFYATHAVFWLIEASYSARFTFWTRVFSDWDAKWKSVPKEDSPRQERDSNAPEPSPSTSTSSSSSPSLPEEGPSSFPQQKGGRKKSKYSRKAFAKTVNEAIQRTLIKRKARKWLTQLIAGLEHQRPNLNQAWRQRRVAGEELLRIAEQEADGDVVVARRFILSLTKQAIGIRAILQLCEEETDDSRLPPPLRHIGSESDLRYPKSRISHRLMVLIMLHTDRLLFLGNIVTGALKKGIDYGFRGILFLAPSIPDFFDHVDPAVISEYAARAIKNHSLPNARWYQGIELLHHSFCHGSNTEQGKAAAVATGQLILNSAMKLCRDKSWDMNSLLRVVLRTCLVAKNKRILPFTLPAALLSNIIQTGSSRSRMESIDRASALVLKVHAVCADQLKIGSIASPKQVAWLVEVSMEVVYEPKYRQDLIEKELTFYHRSPLHLDEDAFGILCDLPEPAFQDGLKSILFPGETRNWRDSGRSEAKTLDLLLWLSNMPANILKAHRALIGGEACRFLGAILTDTRPPGWQWTDRAEWRAKGEAMTCLGNIIERMDESELHDHVPKTVIEAVVALK